MKLLLLLGLDCWMGEKLSLCFQSDSDRSKWSFPVVVGRSGVCFPSQRDLFEATLEAKRFTNKALDWFGEIDIVNFF